MARMPEGVIEEIVEDFLEKGVCKDLDPGDSGKGYSGSGKVEPGLRPPDTCGKILEVWMCGSEGLVCPGKVQLAFDGGGYLLFLCKIFLRHLPVTGGCPGEIQVDLHADKIVPDVVAGDAGEQVQFFDRDPERFFADPEFFGHTGEFVLPLCLVVPGEEGAVRDDHHEKEGRCYECKLLFFRVQDIPAPESRKPPVGKKNSKKKNRDQQRLDRRAAEPGSQ